MDWGLDWDSGTEQEEVMEGALIHHMEAGFIAVG